MPRRTKQHQFLDAKRLNEAAKEIAEMLEDDAAIVGGYALQIYGSDRLTGDIDIATNDAIEDLPHEKDLSFGGYQSTTPNGTPVDVILRDDEYVDLYEAAINAAEDVEGVPLPVATPEYLAAMKMVAGRGKDDLDLQWLILSGELDIPAARTIIKEFLGVYAGDEFDRIVDEAKWKASKGR